MEKRRSSYLCFGFDDKSNPETFRTCDIVDQRFEVEIPFLLENHMISDIEGLKRVCDHLNHNGIPYFCPGVTASIYALYDLGITKSNPLETHYFCPKCRTFEFISDISNGYELPQKTCSNCGSILSQSGSGISFTPFERQRDTEGNPVVYLAVSSAHYKEVLKLLKEALDYRIPKRIASGETQVGHVILQKHPIVPSWNIDPNKPLTPQEVNDFALTHFLHESGQIDPVLLLFLEERGIKPSTFNDVIKLYGLSHGTYSKMVLTELIDGGINLLELPVFYDEVYSECFNNWGYSSIESEELSHKAHYGNLTPEDLQMLPEHIKHWLTNVTYLFPKSHALEVFHMLYKSL